MVEKSDLLDLLMDIARLVLYTVIVVVVVLVVDSVVLLLLNLLFNLQTDVGTWVILLFFEAVVMMFVIIAEWESGGKIERNELELHYVIDDQGRPIFLPRRTPQKTSEDTSLETSKEEEYLSRYSRFRLSIGLAGVVLIILCVYLVAIFYGV